MEIKLTSGRVLKMKKDISLDERDGLLDSIEYEFGEDGKLLSVKMMNKTITKWIRACVNGNTSDKDLMGGSTEERTDAFIKLQNSLTMGEGKASK